MSGRRPLLGIIGGTGLYAMRGLERVERVEVDTPFGKPSDAVVVGDIGGVPVAFLARHGQGHRLIPSEIPYRANIYALKVLGVERVVSVSAVGSLREEVAPLDLLVPSQLIDRTRRGSTTFFGEGIVVHVGLADPFCPDLSAQLATKAESTGRPVHRGGAYVVMEGPAFSTRAESNVYRSWGASVIGMTAIPEARLAREAEMCYATLCCVTDYDVWRETEEAVSVELVLANLAANAEASQRTVRVLAQAADAARDCACSDSLATAIVTRNERVPAATKARLWPLISKYMG